MYIYLYIYMYIYIYIYIYINKLSSLQNCEKISELLIIANVQLLDLYNSLYEHLAMNEKSFRQI